MTEPTNPAGTGAPVPAADDTRSFAQQVADSRNAPAPGAAPAAAPAKKSDATPQETPPDKAGDSDLQDKLAAAEKRLQETQRWGHTNAEEAKQLRTALTAIQNHPILGKLLETLSQQQQGGGQDSAMTAEDSEELRRAWLDYQGAKTEEEAFQKLLHFSEVRASKKATAQMAKQLQEREIEARVQHQQRLIVSEINKTVRGSAPDVPLELFWAMSQRAEAECPATITDASERIQWQVGRAIDLSRQVMKPQVEGAARAGAEQAAVGYQANAIMPGGSSSPSGAPASPGQPRTMADVIRKIQTAQMTRKA